MISDLDGQLDRLLDLSFDFLCEQPLSQFLVAEDVVKALDEVTQPNRVARFLSRLVGPSRERLLALGRASQLTVAAWIPEATRVVLADVLGRPLRLPKDDVEKIVASEKVRESVKRMLEETFTTFVEKAFAGGAQPNAKPGVRNLLGLGVRTATAAGKGMFDALTGGLGDELKRQVETRLRDFVDLGVTLIQRRLVERLTSEDTAEQLGRQRRQFFLDTMARSELDVATQIGRTPFVFWDGLIPVLVTHNWQRQAVRAAIVAEIDATLHELAGQNVGEILDELGLRQQVRELLRLRARPLLQKFVADPRFGAWLAAAFTPRFS